MCVNKVFGLEGNHEFYSEKLVQRINELCYDFFDEGYEAAHPEIFKCEKERWERIAKLFVKSINPKVIVDIGTGTGFVPLTIAKLAGKADTFICTDISEGILSVAKRNICKQNFNCSFKFIKIESRVPFQLPLETASIDLITVNSVLHHIKDTTVFLNEIDRILKRGGLLFIAHEPNKYFNENQFLHFNYVLLNSLSFSNIKKYAFRFFNKIRIIKKAYYLFFPKRKKIAEEYEKAIDKINQVLLNESLIQKPLLSEEVVRAVEIKELEGFKPDLFLKGHELLHYETYDHLSWVFTRHNNNPVIKRYDSFLRRRYPKSGSLFFLVLKKS